MNQVPFRLIGFLHLVSYVPKDLGFSFALEAKVRRCGSYGAYRIAKSGDLQVQDKARYKHARYAVKSDQLVNLDFSLEKLTLIQKSR